jgi:predicted nucleic acid-binding protein
MICLDTTFLIDLWRNRHDSTHAAVRLLAQNSAELFVVPVMAVGEFLEGAAYISEARYREALVFLAAFEFGSFSPRTASQYAHVTARLRHHNQLKGRSQADLWIAAFAIEHRSRLASRNRRHFEGIDGLDLLDY